jgi:hypothetical protein
MTDNPYREKEFIKKMKDLYSLDAMLDKNIVAQNTATFIEERLLAIENELKLAEEVSVQYLEKYDLVQPIIEQELFLNEEIEYRKQLADVETQINMMKYLCNFIENKNNADELLPAMLVTPTYQSQQNKQGELSRVSVSNLSLMTAVEEYNSLVMK